MTQLRTDTRFLCFEDLRSALTLWPEWGYAVASMEEDLPEPFKSMAPGELEQFLKRIENRPWCSAPMVGKWLMIHSGGTIGGGQLSTQEAIHLVNGMAELAGIEGFRVPVQKVVTSAIVAVARIEGFVQRRGTRPVFHRGSIAQFEEMKLAPAWWVEDQIGWILKDVIRLPTPVKCGGAQKLWIPSEELRRQVLHQVQSVQLQSA